MRVFPPLTELLTSEKAEQLFCVAGEYLFRMSRKKSHQRQYKYHPHGSVLYVTSSIEEGHLLLCNPLCRILLESCLAAALFYHPVDLCHFIVESTHIHMIFVVKNPEDVPGFLGYFKRESAHMLNRILGRNKRTIWCEGYDSPIVLTPLRALVAIAYIYSNPAKDNLTESIKEYEGFSSWRMFTTGNHTEKYKGLHRPHFEHLPVWKQNYQGYRAEAERVLSESTECYTLTLSPNAWLDSFGITSPLDQKKWNDRILTRINALETRAAKIRKRIGRKVIGVERLRNQRFNLLHRPVRSGKRTWCLSEKRSIREKFISFLKDLTFKARKVYQQWKLGDFSVPFPPGLHAPNMPRLANVMP